MPFAVWKQPITPTVPAARPSEAAPCAWAASSINGMPYRSASARNGPNATARPYRCTGRIAAGRGVIAASIEKAVFQIDVGEAGDRACLGDAAGGRNRAVGRGEHEIAGADSERAQSEMDRVGSGSDPHGVAEPDVGGELLLEALQLFAEDEPTAFQDACDRPIELFANSGDVRLEIADWDHAM